MKSMFKKSLSLVLALALVISVLPVWAAAAAPVISKVTSKTNLNVDLDTNRITISAGAYPTTYSLSDLEITFSTPGLTYKFSNSQDTAGNEISTVTVASGASGAYVVAYEVGDTSNVKAYEIHFNIIKPIASTVNISLNAGQGYTFKPGDFENKYTRNGCDTLKSVKITSSVSASGSLLYNNGSAESAEIPINSVGNLRFVPAEGSTSATFNYTAIDQQGNESALAQITISLSAPTAPTLTSFSKSLAIDAPYTFNASDFKVNGSNAVKIKITSAPAYGTLQYGSTTITTANVPFDVPTISSLKYTAPNTIPGASPSFGWNGTLTASPENYAANSATCTFTITSGVTAGKITKTVARNTTAYFSQTEFVNAYSSTRGATLNRIKIMSLPSVTYGTLRLGSNSVTLNQEIYYSELQSLNFVPVANQTGNPVFTYQAYDGTAWSSNATVELNIGGSTTLTASNFSKSVPRSTTTYFTQTEFNNAFYSPNRTTPSSIRIQSLPASYYGYLRLNSGNVTTGQEISYANISNLNFVSNSYTGTVTFTYSAFDGIYESSPATITLYVGSSGTLSNGVKSTALNTRLDFTLSDFTSLYSKSSSSLSSITIESLPSSTYGTLYLNNSTVARGDYISRANIPNLNFRPASGRTGTATFTFTATDGSETSNTATMSINIGIATTLSDGTKNIEKNARLDFTLSDFTSLYTKSSGSLSGITIVSLPSSYYGTLYLNNSLVYEGEYISRANIPNLNFRPASGVTGTASFTLTAEDSYETSNVATMRINIGTVSNTLSNGARNTALNTRLDFTLADFTSLYSKSSSSLSGIRIETLPSSYYGTLYLNNSQVYEGEYVSRANIPNLNFRPSSGVTGMASFTFTATDGSDTSNVATMSINIGVTNIGNAPYISSFSITQEYTTSRTITCNISAYDPMGGTPTYMRLAVNGGEYGAQIAYSTSFSYTLPSTQGQHTVSVKVLNSSGLISNAAAATVVYDVSPPMIIGAVISDSRRTITVTFNEVVSTIKSNNDLRNSIQFGYSGSSYAYPEGSDSVMLSDSTMTIYLASPLADIYDRVMISGGTVYDRAGNYSGSSYQADIEGTPIYTTNRNSGARRMTVTFGAEAPASSGGLTSFVDPLTLTSIIDGLGFSDAELVFEMPVSGGTASSRTLTLPGELFSPTNLSRVKNIVLTDGSVDIRISTEAIKDTIKDYNAPFSITLSSVSLSDLSVTNASFSRTISFSSGGFEITQLNGRNPIRFSAPYSSASDRESDMVVVLRREGTSNYTPIPSSSYVNGSYDASAYVNTAGTYVVGINNVSFTDVPASLWAEPFISHLAARKILEGVGSGRFSPAGTVTRAEYLKMLTAALNIVDENASCNMIDVTTDKWYYKYVASAVKAGIITDRTTLNPETAITREEMCLYAYLAANSSGFTYSVTNYNPPTFSDQSLISSNCLNAVIALQKANIIAGYDGKFNPKGSMTRAEAAKVIAMVMAEQRKGY